MFDHVWNGVFLRSGGQTLTMENINTPNQEVMVEVNKSATNDTFNFNLMLMEHVYDEKYDLVLCPGKPYSGSEFDFAKLFAELDAEPISELFKAKNHIDYLPWAVVYKRMFMIDPNVRYVVHRFYNATLKTLVPFEDLGAAGLMVHTGIVLKGKKINMYLPIMDYANRPITLKSLSTTLLNKNILRCMVKNFAQFGYGLRLWTGEDLPSEEGSSNTNEKKNIDNKKGVTVTPKQKAMIERNYKHEIIEAISKKYGYKSIDEWPIELATRAVQDIINKSNSTNEKAE